MRVHVATVHSTNEKSYKCDHCEKVFGHENYLKNHVARVHENVQGFTCEICSKTFRQKGSLKKHEKTFHQEIKEFQCDSCTLFWLLL